MAMERQWRGGRHPHEHSDLQPWLHVWHHGHNHWETSQQLRLQGLVLDLLTLAGGCGQREVREDGAQKSTLPLPQVFPKNLGGADLTLWRMDKPRGGVGPW